MCAEFSKRAGGAAERSAPSAHRVARARGRFGLGGEADSEPAPCSAKCLAERRRHGYGDSDMAPSSPLRPRRAGEGPSCRVLCGRLHLPLRPSQPCWGRRLPPHHDRRTQPARADPARLNDSQGGGPLLFLFSSRSPTVLTAAIVRQTGACGSLRTPPAWPGYVCSPVESVRSATPVLGGRGRRGASARRTQTLPSHPASARVGRPCCVSDAMLSSHAGRAPG